MEGVLRASQIGMLAYRQTLPINTKVGSFSRFSSVYKGLGVAGRTFRKASTFVGTRVSIFSGGVALQNGQISSALFMYRTTGTAASLYGGVAIGTQFGGPYGAVAGATIGGSFWAGERVYTGINAWLRELSKGFTNYQQAVRNGWIPMR